jgi:hypothetical protein
MHQRCRLGLRLQDGTPKERLGAVERTEAPQTKDLAASSVLAVVGVLPTTFPVVERRRRDLSLAVPEPDWSSGELRPVLL